MKNQSSYIAPFTRVLLLRTEDLLSFNSHGNETLQPGEEEDL